MGGLFKIQIGVERWPTVPYRGKTAPLAFVGGFLQRR